MKVQVCSGKKCAGAFSEYIITRLENDKKKFDMEKLEIVKSPCMGKCKLAPNIKIDDELYSKVVPYKASELVTKTYKGN